MGGVGRVDGWVGGWGRGEEGCGGTSRAGRRGWARPPRPDVPPRALTPVHTHPHIFTPVHTNQHPNTHPRGRSASARGWLTRRRAVCRGQTHRRAAAAPGARPCAQHAARTRCGGVGKVHGGSTCVQQPGPEQPRACAHAARSTHTLCVCGGVGGVGVWGGGVHGGSTSEQQPRLERTPARERSQHAAARSTQHAARSTQHAARSTQHACSGACEERGVGRTLPLFTPTPTPPTLVRVSVVCVGGMAASKRGTHTHPPT
jgi:hypothetical protein